MQKTISLNPGESKLVSFAVTPTGVGLHTVSVDGLSGSFTVLEPPALSILGAKLYDARWGPCILGGYVIFGKVDVTITNNGGKTLSWESPDYVDLQVTILRASDRGQCGFVGFPRDIPPGTNTITLNPTEWGWRLSEFTLSPGTFNYILKIKVWLIGWPGLPYVEAEFPGTTVLG